MNFTEFKERYQKVPVIEYSNNRKSKKPLVTVKIVTYNHAEFISECLDSVINQKTNFDYEILIAEDASSDGTRDICISYAERFPDKIKLFLNSRENNIYINNKPTGTFNNTYANYNITSKYACILEGDDYWTDSNSLQKRVDFLENNSEYVSCFHNISVIKDGKLFFPEGKLPYKQNTTIESADMINTYMPTNTVMSRSFLISPFEEELKNIICGDLVARGKLSQYGKSMFLSNVKCSVYRMHQGGIYSSETMTYRNTHALKANQYLIDFFEKEKLDSSHAKESLVEGYLICFFNSLKETKKLNIYLILEGFQKSKKLEVSFSKILKKYLVVRIKNRLLK